MAYGFILTCLSAIAFAVFLNYLSITAALLKFAISIPFRATYVYVSDAFPSRMTSIAIQMLSTD
jgi:hypothetical protein